MGMTDDCCKRRNGAFFFRFEKPLKVTKWGRYIDM
jgi:hypothetical protein